MKLFTGDRIVKKRLPLIILCILTVSCFHKLPEISYEEYIQTVNQLEKSNKYDEARELSYNMMKRFPENEFDIMKEIIFINRKTGNYEDNIELWQKGHEKGYFFFIHPALPVYEPYLGMDGFDEIASRDMAMRDSANEMSHCAYRIITEEYIENEKKPLILIFHGGGSSIDRAIKSWIIPQAMMDEYIIAFVQSYRHNDFNTYGWGVGDSILHSGMKTLFDEICTEAQVDRMHVYAMGISAGAAAAIDIASSGTIDIRGVYALCPAMPVEYLKEHTDGLQHINIAMLCGDEDRMIEGQQEMFELMKQHNINAMFTIIKGMEHGFPDNQEEHLNDALNFIRGETE